MAKLFVILAVFCIFGAVLVRGFDKKAAVQAFMAKMDDCKAEVGAKDSDVEELVGKKAASTMEGKCLRSCLMKKYEVMDNNGKFLKDVALTHAHKYTDGSEERMKIAHEIIDNCSSIDVSDDHCEAAEQYGKCFSDQAKAHNIKDDFDY
ncbi:Pheromone-binding protein-related protein 5 [Lucilia cuprina]|uniref:Pheromone-binding protein-related protein 5 n=1 Tax=Lucilia cuprina TaxID=7375 RepID=A0A0L0C3E7_LUCCU|nr:Pheromone-binding protein-related protein 5 [Lucilia cuprina]